MVQMQFLIIAAAVLHAGVSSEAKLVWGAIYFIARPTGICNLTCQEIGTLVGLPKRAVMQALPELTSAGLLVDAGGGKGVARKFSIPLRLRENEHHADSDAGTTPEPLRKQNRYGNGSGPVPITNRTGTESVPPYKEEKNNNNKSASADAETSLSLPKLQQKWFEEEFWPIFWRKRDKSEAFDTFKSHATNATTKDRIVAALKVQSPEMQGRPEQFRPYASTWLSKRRYDDDPPLAGDVDSAAPAPWEPTWQEPANNA
jgi:hypothetical protein